MSLESTLSSVISYLRSDVLQSEAQVRQAVILPVLRQLGWDDLNPSEVRSDYPVGKGRVDYALMVAGEPVVMIEVKHVGGLSPAAESQVFADPARNGTPILVLTDGRVWDMYLSTAPGGPSEGKFCQIDLVAHITEQVVPVLQSYLAKQSVSSGDARRRAEAMHGVSHGN